MAQPRGMGDMPEDGDGEGARWRNNDGEMVMKASTILGFLTTMRIYGGRGRKEE
jgi:hypothetical protein